MEGSVSEDGQDWESMKASQWGFYVRLCQTRGDVLLTVIYLMQFLRQYRKTKNTKKYILWQPLITVKSEPSVFNSMLRGDRQVRKEEEECFGLVLAIVIFDSTRPVSIYCWWRAAQRGRKRPELWKLFAVQWNPLQVFATEFGNVLLAACSEIWNDVLFKF